jgi:hypothetical protein
MAEETSPGEVIAPEVEEVIVEGAVDDDGNAIEAEIELDDEGNPVEPEPEPEPDDETDEIEKNGEKYRIPKALKDNFMMSKDYTHKTQALAQERQQVATTLQTVETALQQARTVSEAEVQARAQVIAIDAQLAAFQTIDWRAFNQADPAAASAEFMEWRGLKDARQEAVNNYGQAVQQRTQAEQQAIQARTSLEQQETARLREQGKARIAAQIPDWSEDKAKTLLSFGQKQYGFTQEELDSLTDPRIVLALNDAFKGAQATTKTKTVAKVAAQQAVKPAGKVTGAAAPIRPLDDRASTDAWMKARVKQVSSRKPN